MSHIEGKKINTKLIVRYAFRETMGLVFMGVALFWPAGTYDWCPAWATLLLTLLWIVATAIAILRHSPDLLAERLGPRKGAKSWDLTILSILGILQLARYIIAGFDRRYGWTTNFALSTQWMALIVCALGYAIFVWAIASNAFFSQMVRIQPERGQTVVDSGPYRYVRHPAYLGAILVELAVPVLLASWWCLAVSGVTIALLILRTSLEDRTLHRELSGYAEYAGRSRFRLLPGIW